MTVQDKFIDIGLKLHIRHWTGEKRPFVLLHGLSSNCRTWDLVAGRLSAAGHQVISVDQRGHGLSDKPDDGYDPATIAADLKKLLEALALEKPVIMGQSWGGNVVLEFGAAYPGLAHGLGFVDGGYIDFQSRPDSSWEVISERLKPPHLTGTPWAAFMARVRERHPDWSEDGINATLANFEIMPDDTIRPWLSLERHMKILRGMWEQQASKLYPQVQEPVLIAVANDNRNSDWLKIKTAQVAAAEAGLKQVEVTWFEDTDHDIHIQRPELLTTSMLDALQQGVWSGD